MNIKNKKVAGIERNHFMNTLQKTVIAISFILIITASLNANTNIQPCKIKVIEKGTGWPVPMVELKTLHNIQFVTDNAGVIAFDLPELMGKETWFTVKGYGYDVPKDGFGYSGVRLTPTPGKTLAIEVERKIIAKRLGRVTGAGLFAESQKLSEETGWKEYGVLGCDSVQNTIYNGRLFWLWGDTTLSRYPLGIFHGTNATTSPQPLTSFEPPLRLKLSYFFDEEKGRPRQAAPMPGDGPTWVSGYVSLPDKNGTNHLVGVYAKIKPPMDAYKYGMCIWNDEISQFEHLKTIWTKSEDTPEKPPLPEGQTVLWTDGDGKKWVLFGISMPTLRCPATFEAWQDQSTWQVLTPQEYVTAAESGEEIKPHSGSIAWSPFRKRWVMIFMQWFGKPAAFGELWYTEADLPTGPWGPAVKILSHGEYSFYNPKIHPEFTPENSPILLFEATYTILFTESRPTPRYDYNQILYRLDLNDPALSAAQK